MRERTRSLLTLTEEPLSSAEALLVSIVFLFGSDRVRLHVKAVPLAIFLFGGIKFVLRRVPSLSKYIFDPIFFPSLTSVKSRYKSIDLSLCKVCLGSDCV